MNTDIGKHKFKTGVQLMCSEDTFRVTIYLENLRMSGNLPTVRVMSGESLVRENFGAYFKCRAASVACLVSPFLQRFFVFKSSVVTFVVYWWHGH